MRKEDNCLTNKADKTWWARTNFFFQ